MVKGQQIYDFCLSTDAISYQLSAFSSQLSALSTQQLAVGS